MFHWLTQNLIWMHGQELLLVTLGLAFIGIWYRSFRYLAGFWFLFCFYFFRNPLRVCPEATVERSVIVCPADGKIVSIDTLNDDPDFDQKVSIFMSPLDVHVNRMPVTGKIKEIKYKRGAFAMAFLPKSSELNERNDILLETDSGKLVKVRQIAGIIARRILCWVREGEHREAGNLFGMIKFSSRVDLFLPQGTNLSVVKGQRVYGGQTVLGKLQDDKTLPSG